MLAQALPGEVGLCLGRHVYVVIPLADIQAVLSAWERDLDRSDRSGCGSEGFGLQGLPVRTTVGGSSAFLAQCSVSGRS